MSIRVHGNQSTWNIQYSMVYLINVPSRDRNKAKSLSSRIRTKKILGKYFTEYRK